MTNREIVAQLNTEDRLSELEQQITQVRALAKDWASWYHSNSHHHVAAELLEIIGE